MSRAKQLVAGDTRRIKDKSVKQIPPIIELLPDVWGRECWKVGGEGNMIDG